MGARAGCFVSMALRLGDGTPAEPWCGRPEAGWGYPHPVPGGPVDGNPERSCHSVGAMFLLRDLVSPRTWLAMISHLAGLFLGHRGHGGRRHRPQPRLQPAGAGADRPAHPGPDAAGRDVYATAERARLGLMLGVRIPAWPAEARAGYRWGIVPRWRMLTERATWGEIGYGLLRLPVSAVAVDALRRGLGRGPGHADAAAVQLVAAQRRRQDRRHGARAARPG